MEHGYVFHTPDGKQMRIAILFAMSLGLAASAHATPVTLVCTGSITFEGKEATIDRETAILDLEKPSFKPPNYPEFPYPSDSGRLANYVRV
jgi:hypothetical protein